MIIKKRVKDFENLGFGLFVHFGLYSVLGIGEWAKKNRDIPWKEYAKAEMDFNPSEDWAVELVSVAKQAGCKYVTLTTRHHDGFSLYDTRGLSEYDAPHICGRDLVAEFVDACRKHDIIPFFYHTLLDWHEENYTENFSEYLKYLRNSVEILCTRYGKIGGIWFDGMWDKPDADWEEDALYQLIRQNQPESIIINNTGIHHRGALGHIELDSVTFENGRPQPINLEESPKYLASEMCETLNDHWGYAALDFHYKSPKDIIESLSACRRYHANFLLNIGPMGDGRLRLIDKGILEIVGDWVKRNDEAVRKPAPTKIAIQNKPSDFILYDGNAYYLFIHHLAMQGDENVVSHISLDLEETFAFDRRIKSAEFLDNGEKIAFTQKDGYVTIYITPFRYGESQVIRIVRFVV